MTSQCSCLECGAVFIRRTNGKFCSPECRIAAYQDRRNEISRNWRKRNPEKMAASCHHWNENNREKLTTIKRDWRKANKGKNAIYKRRRREKNPEAVREDYSRWFETHKNEAFARMREWIKKNPEKRAAIIHRRRARKLSAKGYHTGDDLKQLWKKQNGHCANQYCSKLLTPKTRHLDHIIPLAAGGTNFPENLQWLCKQCNSRKWAKLPDAWLADEKRRYTSSAN